jgi:hypothetical protein
MIFHSLFLSKSVSWERVYSSVFLLKKASLWVQGNDPVAFSDNSISVKISVLVGVFFGDTMKNVKNMVLLSAVFAFGICAAVEQDAVAQDSVVHVVNELSDSPLHKLLILRPGRGLFFANWPTAGDQAESAKKLDEYVQVSFDGLAQELSEDAEFISDIAQIVKKYVAMSFKYAGAIQFLGLKNDFSAGNAVINTLLEDQIKAAGLNVGMSELVDWANTLVGDVLAVVKKHKPEYDTTQFEQALRMVLNLAAANMQGAQVVMTEEQQQQVLAAFLDAKQEVLSSFSDEDLMNVVGVLQQIQDRVEFVSPQVESLWGNDISRFAKYDFSTNSLITRLAVVQDDSLAFEGGFKIRVSKDAEGIATLHVPSSVKIVSSEPVDAGMWVTQDPKEVVVFTGCTEQDFASAEESSCTSDSCEQEECIECVE